MNIVWSSGFKRAFKKITKRNSQLKEQIVETLILLAADPFTPSLQSHKLSGNLDELIIETLRDPFAGIGKPEPLKENLAGFWSRRIDDNNRLVYAVDDDYLTIIACRYHYS